MGNKFLDGTALTIAIIGAINWALIGIFRFDSPLKIPTLIMESPRTFRIKDSPLGTTSAGTGKYSTIFSSAKMGL